MFSLSTLSGTAIHRYVWDPRISLFALKGFKRFMILLKRGHVVNSLTGLLSKTKLGVCQCGNFGNHSYKT